MLVLLQYLVNAKTKIASFLLNSKLMCYQTQEVAGLVYSVLLLKLIWIVRAPSSCSQLELSSG